MELLWLLIVAVLFGGWFALDGFVVGAGLVLPFLRGRDTERRAVLTAVGPFLLANEVWLVATAGVLVGAFPVLEGAVLSGLYPVVTALLVSWAVRDAGFWFRSRRESERWRRGWEGAIFAGSAGLAVTIGLTVGNLAGGVPGGPAGIGVLDPVALLCAVWTTGLFAMHGALFLSLRLPLAQSPAPAALAGRLVVPAAVTGAVTGLAVVLLGDLDRAWAAAIPAAAGRGDPARRADARRVPSRTGVRLHGRGRAVARPRRRRRARPERRRRRRRARDPRPARADGRAGASVPPARPGVAVVDLPAAGRPRQHGVLLMRVEERRLLAHLPGARRHLAWTVLTATAVAVLIIAQAELLSGVLATGTGLPALWLFVAVLAVRALLGRLHQAAAQRAAERLKARLRARVLERTQELGPGWLSGRRAGELTTALGRGLDALDPYLTGYLPQLCTAAAVPAALCVWLAAADPASALIVAVTIPLIPIFGVLIGLRTRAAAERRWRQLARLGGHFLDVVNGLPTLRVFGRATAQARVVREAADAHRSVTLRVLRVAFLSAFVLELVATFSVALVAVPIGLRLRSGDLPLETGLLVLLLVPEVYVALRAVGTRFHEAVEGLAVARQLFEVLDAPEPPPPARPLAAPPGPVAIRLDDLRVRYPDRGAPALDGLSLTVEPGERVALVGPSGAGKSTVLRSCWGWCPPRPDARWSPGRTSPG
ncbi:cytochrome d ubiquinol oxidase subunit II, partial [Actinomadura sp. CNU-125]|uniref:cytochrome d ubiquinol oxidase subunit II n=1 Tax=Actinomadura sp. CNU-125 TaxID=1904961 RepID=UPI001177FB63